MDRPTRGKTRPGRLGLLDRWTVHQRVLDGREYPLVVDVGIGALPHTTLEWFKELRSHWPQVELLGTDVDEARVVAAQMWTRPGLTFAQAGFELQLERPAAVIRAMNVLRQYRPAEVSRAHALLGQSLAPGGLLLEGTCGPEGAVLCCLILRRGARALAREALIFGFEGTEGFAPRMFRDRLPRDIRDQGGPGFAVGQFLERWQAVWEDTRHRDDSPAAAFRRSAVALRQSGEPMEVDLMQDGVVVWRPTNGVPDRV